ncbi:MAG: LuxR C-terminal-related transcriptional regulator [Bryobacteraceae bacterium]
MTRVLIAAPSPALRAGLETLVSHHSELEIAGAFADLGGAEAVRADVVLVAAAGFEALLGSGLEAPVVLLASGAAPPPLTREAFDAGVRAVLAPDASAQVIVASIEAAAAGLAVMDPRELEPLLALSAAAPAASQGGALTAREREVLRMMADGDANKEIAWKLAISEHTVKFHVASILAKLGATSRAEAVGIGLRRGLVPL